MKAKRDEEERKPHTRIVCTIGPACRSPEKIEALIKAGMAVARLHFSYAGQEEHAENIRRIRKAAGKLGRKIKILQDLSGTKARLGDFLRDEVELKKGAVFRLTSRPVKGDSSIASVNIPELISVIEPGDLILLADGELLLKAAGKHSLDVDCRVMAGGKIKSGQAVHVPGKAAPVPVPTAKDLDDVRFGLEHQVDWIAQSYATLPEEIYRLRAFILEQGARTPVMVKMERKKALDNLEAMVRAADMVMVARGDLGLEIPLEQIAIAQKEIIRCANRARKPVITATEMLFSMMDKDRPTRAEVADVTNAIFDGSDGVMLSGETAMGHFPIQAAQTMARIVAVADEAKRRMIGGAVPLERFLKSPAEPVKTAPRPFTVRRRKPL